MLYKLSVLALVSATYALPNNPPSYPQPPVYGETTTTTEAVKTYPAQYPETTTSTVEHPPKYGSSSSSSSSSVSTSKTAPVYPSKYSTTEPVKYSTTTSTGKHPASTATCPAPGSYDSQHRYSCNPAHQYPGGQTCELVDGCYFLKYPETSSKEVPHYTSEAPHYSTKVVASLTTYCPQPTTFTHGASTYTVTKATTLVLPCPGGCTITKSHPPVYHPTGSVKTSSTASNSETPKSYAPHETTASMTTYPVTSTITTFKPTSVPVYSTKGTTFYSTSLTVSYSVSTWLTTKTVDKPTAPVATHPVSPPVASCPVCPVYSCPPPVTVTTTIYSSMQPPPTSVPQKPNTYVAPPPEKPTTVVVPPQPEKPSTYAPPAPPKETKTTETKTTVKTTETKATVTKTNSVPVAPYPTTSTKSIPVGPTAPVYHPQPTPSCPAPGAYDNKHRYSCNPAHSYPEGQTCKLVDGCYYLEYPKQSTGTQSAPTYPVKTSTESKPVHKPTTESKPVYSVPTYAPSKSSETHPVPTPSCPAPGSYDNKHRYSCNPAHAYPTGQTCKLIDGCYYLEYPKQSTETHPAPTYSVKTSTESKPVYSVPTYAPSKSSETHPAPTPSCPAPGSYDNKHRYSCNPAHAYPTGQTCELIDGCYFLEYEHPQSSTTTKPVEHPTTYPSPPKYETTTTKPVELPTTYPSPPKYETTTEKVPSYPTTTESAPSYETPASYPAPKGY